MHCKTLRVVLPNQNHSLFLHFSDVDHRWSASQSAFFFFLASSLATTATPRTMREVPSHHRRLRDSPKSRRP